MYHTEVFNELIITIIRGLIIPLVPVLTVYLTKLIKKLTDDLEDQINETEFVQSSNIVENVINTATTAVEQIYTNKTGQNRVDNTDDEGKWILDMIKDTSVNIISDKVMDKLAEKYPNLDKWIENKVVSNSNKEIMQNINPPEQKEMGVMR